MTRRFLAVAGFVIVSVLAASPAVAQQYPPGENALTLSDTTLVSGQSVTMTAGTFLEGAPVSFTFSSAPVNLGTATADASGRVTLTASIPGDAAAGEHTITASGESASGPLTVSATVTVTDRAGNGPTTTTAGELPPTGLTAGTLTAAVIGVIALTLGAVLALVARRRRYANS